MKIMNPKKQISSVACAGGRQYIQLLFVGMLCLFLLTSCAQIRKVTYPENFIYLQQSQIKSKMAVMSINLRKIDEILDDNLTVSSEQQERILAILASIDETADLLGAGSVATNHWIIDDNIDRFKSAVNVAMNDVRADPPNYYTLGKLSGNCNACHQLRR